MDWGHMPFCILFKRVIKTAAALLGLSSERQSAEMTKRGTGLRMARAGA
jgi:hypothetical protein